MSGTLGLATPWARARFTPGDIDEIEALIPSGYQINVNAHNGTPGSFDLLVFAPGRTGRDFYEPVLRWDNRHDPVSSARALAERLRVRVGDWQLADDLTVTVPLTNGGAA